MPEEGLEPPDTRIVIHDDLGLAIGNSRAVGHAVGHNRASGRAGFRVVDGVTTGPAYRSATARVALLLALVGSRG
jgi:hypothetical protein